MMYKRRLSALNLPHINVHIPRAFFGGNFWKFSNLSVNFTIFSFKTKNFHQTFETTILKKKAMIPILKINLNYLQLCAKFTKAFPSALPRMHKLLYRCVPMLAGMSISTYQFDSSNLYIASIE